MAVITSVSPQKSKNRVNIGLDGKFGFGLDLENFMRLGLKVEQELSDSEIEKIVNLGEFAKVLNNLLRFATLRPRSEKEIKDWFVRKKVHESMYEKLLLKLQKLELIDDTKFAKWWISQRMEFKHKSMKELEYELRNKGIDKSVIVKALKNASLDEIKIASELLVKNEYKWMKYDGRIAKQKKAEFLARKGFGWQTIKKVLDKINSK